MAFGKSIRIYLKEGDVTGLKFSEVVNHTIQSISCPRIKTTDLADIKEARRPGVYFLFGKDDETNEDMAYIGEAENVFDRLQNHLLNKDFWNEVVIFISKDENLTKAHVKYLESRIIQIANIAKRYKIENYNQPQLTSLPMADRDAMEEFLLQVKMLIGIMGHKIMEEVIQVSKQTPLIETKLATTVPANLNFELFLSVAGLEAKGVQTNEGFVVLSGSDVSSTFTGSLSFGYRELRQKLIDSGTLQTVGDRYKFQNDELFSSPSAAAAIIVGYSINGPFTWKNKEGKNLKTIEQERLENHNTYSNPDPNSIL